MSNKLYFFVDIYIKNVDDEYKLSLIRNDLLTRMHKRIPSYCHWSGDDIIGESRAQRIGWLTSFAKENSNFKMIY